MKTQCWRQGKHGKPCGEYNEGHESGLCPRHRAAQQKMLDGVGKQLIANAGYLPGFMRWRCGKCNAELEHPDRAGPRPARHKNDVDGSAWRAMYCDKCTRRHSRRKRTGSLGSASSTQCARCGASLPRKGKKPSRYCPPGTDCRRAHESDRKRARRATADSADAPGQKRAGRAEKKNRPDNKKPGQIRALEEQKI